MSTATKRAAWRTLAAAVLVALVMPAMTLVTGHEWRTRSIWQIAALDVAGLLLLFWVLRRRYASEQPKP